MAFCRTCGAQLADGAVFCSGCGTSQTASGATATGAAPAPAPGAPPVAAPMANNVAGLLCYIFGFITGIIFLVIEPYKNNKFVRFHAFQSIFFSVAVFAIYMIWGFVFTSLLFMTGMWSIMLGLFWIIRLACFAAWIFLMFKAYNNEQFKLPVIGDIAAKQAGA